MLIKCFVLDFLKISENTKWRDYEAEASLGEHERLPQPRQRRRNERIARLERDLSEGTITLRAFLETARHLVEPNVRKNLKSFPS